ncbi:multicopper oxidase [Ramaria rubella]|nr:multicopper oxidase [Ramaria rubella]KAF8583897.1 multicopper oxidase [Ramaria rubella]
MAPSLSKLLLGLCAVGTAFGATVLYQLPIVNAPMNADGFERIGVLANSTFPGPLLKFTKGDRAQINVTSLLTNPTMRRSTSVHWHGIFQARSAGNDGPAMVTQCPIAPNNTFLYDFQLADQAGTFWYHSHLSTQYCDGLRGPFVIYDPNDPQAHLYDVDDESTIIQISDYYHNPAPALQAQFLNDAVVPIPDAGTINGKGRFVGGPETPFSIVNVQQGLRYRLRFINIACRPFYTVSIDMHNLTIIEADGISHVPHTVGSFEIFVAQRYSAVLNANQPVANYWIRAPPTGGVGGPTGNPNLDPTLTLAVLHYAGAPNAEPDGTTNSTATDLLLEQDLAALIDPGSPGGDVPPDVGFEMIITQPNPPFFEINGISFEPPAVPALLQILSGASSPNDFLPHENMVLLPQNAIVEVSIPGTGAHPIHLHGHAFDVIRSSNSNVTNFVNPPRRDVVAVNGGNTTFRFLTNNPGPWFLHCHIDWHLEVGLAVIFGEAAAAQRMGNQSVITSPAWNQLCPIYNQLDPSLQ